MTGFGPIWSVLGPGGDGAGPFPPAHLGRPGEAGRGRPRPGLTLSRIRWRPETDRISKYGGSNRRVTPGDLTARLRAPMRTAEGTLRVRKTQKRRDEVPAVAVIVVVRDVSQDDFAE